MLNNTNTSNNSTSNNTSNMCDTQKNDLCDSILLDIAVLCQDYSPIVVTPTNYHIIELDEIPIEECIFKQIFYPYGENFGLDKKNCSNPQLLKYISFEYPYRTVHNNQPFSLLETIILNIEDDLNVTRNCFTTCTLIELSKELSSIRTLCDINCCSLLCCLSWSNIINILRTGYVNVENHPFKNVLLVINVIFKSVDPKLLPTIVKFRYKVDLNDILNTSC
jgi:hypothetical protein